jgi:hypothetical protein
MKLYLQVFKSKKVNQRGAETEAVSAGLFQGLN